VIKESSINLEGPKKGRKKKYIYCNTTDYSKGI